MVEVKVSSFPFHCDFDAISSFFSFLFESFFRSKKRFFCICYKIDIDICGSKVKIFYVDSITDIESENFLY